jgi:hypothetical protein
VLLIEPIALTADMRRDLAERADLKRQLLPLLKIVGLLAVLCGGLVAAFFILTAMIEADGWIPASDVWRTVALSFGLGLALAIIGVWSPVMALREAAREAAVHLKRGDAERVRLDLPERHLIINNDGQLLCFFSVPGDRAIYFEINGFPQDPRWRAYEQGYLFRRTWTWTRVPGSRGLWHFETAGEPLAKLNLVRPHAADLYEWEDALGFAPWPKDGDTVDIAIRKLETIGARIELGETNPKRSPRCG